MWMASGVVWEFEFDWSAGEHHEREGGFGGVEAVGAADDQPDVVVEAFGAAVGQPALDGGVDSVAEFADRPGGLDEFGDAAALARSTTGRSAPPTVAGSRSPAKISRRASLSG